VPGNRSTEEEWARTVRQLDLGRGTYEASSKNPERMSQGSISWHQLHISEDSGDLRSPTRTKNESDNERDIE
jgi:hypothetical protein